MTNSYDLTERLLLEEQDWREHPDNWRVFFTCPQCGKIREESMHHSEVERGRQAYGLAPNERVTLKTVCDDCGRDNRAVEETP